MIVLNAFLSEVLSYESKLLSYESTLYLRRYVYFRKYKTTNRIILLIRTKVILFLHYTYTTRVHVQRYCISVVRKYESTFVLIKYCLSSYFRKYESTKVLSKVRKYFRTRVRKYGSTFVRKYEDRYFRTKVLSKVLTEVLPEVHVHVGLHVRVQYFQKYVYTYNRRSGIRHQRSTS